MKLSNYFERYVDSEKLDSIARKVGFCKRKRKLLPVDFLRALLFKNFDGQRQSLRDHVIQLATDQNIKLKRQSLNERFTEASSEFVKQVLIDQLDSCNRLEKLPLLDSFQHVYLQDSTKFKLPHPLKASYPGYHQAGASIQLVLDIKQKGLSRISLHPQTYNDSNESTNIDWMPTGSLLIRDLGYFSTDSFKEIQKNQCYFLSRLQPRSALFELKGEQYQRFDMNKLLMQMKKHKLAYVDRQLHFNNHQKFPTRVCFFLVPKSVRDQRMRERSKYIKSRGWTPSKEYAIWTWFNVYITNADNTKIPADSIGKIYQYRWQIELMFKSWKSYYHIERMKSMKKERMECYLYSLLLKTVIHSHVMNMCHKYVKSCTKGGKEISFLKFTKLVIALDPYIHKMIRYVKESMNDFIDVLSKINTEVLVKEAKKKNTSFG